MVGQRQQDEQGGTDINVPQIYKNKEITERKSSQKQSAREGGGGGESGGRVARLGGRLKSGGFPCDSSQRNTL